MDPQGELRQLFTGLVEQAFYSEIGICEPLLTAYLSRLLSEFVHVDAIYRVHAADGSSIQSISEVQAAAELGDEPDETARMRVVNRYVGDFALFWTGMYPETLRARRQWGIDRLREYTLQGKRGYGIASDLSRFDDVPPGELLRLLSEQFECCVEGLHLVRKNWERVPPHPRHN